MSIMPEQENTTNVKLQYADEAKNVIERFLSGKKLQKGFLIRNSGSYSPARSVESACSEKEHPFVELEGFSIKDVDIKTARCESLTKTLFAFTFKGINYSTLFSDSQLEKEKERVIVSNGAKALKLACKDLLKSQKLTSRERGFIEDISKKKKLTQKQESWLVSICNNNNVIVSGINVKNSTVEINCEHGDLGSLGYCIFRAKSAPIPDEIRTASV